MKLTDIPSYKNLSTPFYFYDMDILDRTLDTLAELSAKTGIHAHYALKANNEKCILRAISAKGLGADCVSGNEVLLAAECGFPSDRILFAGVGKTDREIVDALNVGAAFNVESLPELKNIDYIASKLGKVADVQLRINPNIDAHTHKKITTGLDENKFGFPEAAFDEVIAVVKSLSNVNFIGIHFHIGSQITDVEEVFQLECERMNEIVSLFEAKGLVVRNIDLGGGLGVDYNDPDRNPIADFNAWFTTIDKYLVRRQDQTVHVEPGRSIVCQCGSLVSTVLYVKNGQNKDFVIIDAGMNDLIRPALYDAYHRVDNVSAMADGRKETATYDVVGPVCESSDVWGEGRVLATTRRGDIVALRSAGAYGSVMASQYNCKVLAPAVFSDDESVPTYEPLF
ncbi:MAG: diaminopimelate decarboxylase [Bacteroidales bacterium]|nr:diaminopimelate decarboxylase [Bacteroidales bacterium]